MNGPAINNETKWVHYTSTKPTLNTDEICDGYRPWRDLWIKPLRLQKIMDRAEQLPDVAVYLAICAEILILFVSFTDLTQCCHTT